MLNGEQPVIREKGFSKVYSVVLTFEDEVGRGDHSAFFHNEFINIEFLTLDHG